MNRRAGRSIDDLFVVLVGMIGGFGGGYWLGLVANVLATGYERLLDLAAGLTQFLRSCSDPIRAFLLMR